MPRPHYLAQRFQRAVREEQISDLEQLWYAAGDEQSPFARGLLQLMERLGEKYQVEELAAAVGVGQSMYQIADYTATNTLGTANLFQAILNTHSTPEKMVVASSMSIYGEGKYLCRECGEIAPSPRPLDQLKTKNWETLCPNCAEALIPVPTPEDKPLQCT